MAPANLKAIAVRIRKDLASQGVTVDGVILFGSHARGQARPDSDVDLAVLSRDFGKDRFEEGVMLNIHGSRIDPRVEAIPVSLSEWFETYPASPILHEIQHDGVFLI